MGNEQTVSAYNEGILLCHSLLCSLLLELKLCWKVPAVLLSPPDVMLGLQACYRKGLFVGSDCPASLADVARSFQGGMLARIKCSSISLCVSGVTAITDPLRSMWHGGRFLPPSIIDLLRWYPVIQVPGRSRVQMPLTPSCLFFRASGPGLKTMISSSQADLDVNIETEVLSLCHLFITVTCQLEACE